MGRVIVQFHKTVPVPDRMTRLETLGNRILSGADSTALYLIEVPVGTEDEWVGRYAQLEGVRIAEKEIFYRHS